jgi:chromosome segregation ATPase
MAERAPIPEFEAAPVAKAPDDIEARYQRELNKCHRLLRSYEAEFVDMARKIATGRAQMEELQEELAASRRMSATLQAALHAAQSGEGQ